jgi:hypothetical protein
MRISITAMVVVSLAMPASAGRLPGDQAGPPSASDLVYETYCKKEEREKRQLFRAAAADQRVTLTRTQLERWRDANHPGLTKEQVTAIDELMAMTTVKLFDESPAGKAMMERFEATADNAFTGRQMNEMAPFGPCIAKK